MKITFLDCVFALFVMVGFEQPARAATLHVPAEYGTIQTAINAAFDGDTIEISPGTYVENLQIRSKGIKLIGTGGAAVTTVRAANFGSVVENINFISPAVTTLQGLTIKGGQQSTGGGLYGAGPAPIVVTDCVFDDNQGLFIWPDVKRGLTT